MAKQVINIGATQGDGTGTNQRDAWDLINDNFTELYDADLEFADALNNVYIINEVGDFPNPVVGGVIELVVNGADTSYQLGAGNIDLGNIAFSATGAAVQITGSHRTASRFTSTSSLDLFVASEAPLFLEFFAVTHPNGDYIINFTSTAGFNSIVLQNIIASECKSIARVDGAFTTSLRTLTTVITTVGGIDWVGSASSQINITNMLALGSPVGWTGTLLNLGTATFDLIVITNDNRWISPAGTTILSGAVSNGNLKSGGRALVRGSIFNGTGTALSGITTQDTQWLFQGNIFVDGSTKNTTIDADAFLLPASPPQVVTISSTGVYVAIGGAEWDSDIGNHFAVSTAGVITYFGLESGDVQILATTTLTKVGGGSDLICTKVAINGTVVDKTVGCTENSSPTQVTSQLLVALEENDTIQLFVGNEGSTSNVEITNSVITVTPQ